MEMERNQKILTPKSIEMIQLSPKYKNVKFLQIRPTFDQKYLNYGNLYICFLVKELVFSYIMNGKIQPKMMTPEK